MTAEISRANHPRGAPADDFDLDGAHAPISHPAAGVFIKIDGIGADERGAVVVDLAKLAGADDEELGADGVAGPIRGGAVDFPASQQSAAGAVVTAGLGLGVGGGADVFHSARAVQSGGVRGTTGREESAKEEDG